MGERSNSFAVDAITLLNNPELDLSEGIPTSNLNDLT